MKYRFWIRTSFLLNAVLAGALAWMCVRGPAWRNAPGSASGPARMQTSIPDSHPSPTETKTVSAGKIPSADWRGWLQELRKAGVPNDVLAGLIISDFQSRWEKQRRQLHEQYARGDIDEAAIAAFEGRHDVGQENELRAALGEDGFRRWDKENALREFDAAKLNLSESESDAIYQLKRDLIEQQRDMAQARRDGKLDEGDYNDQQAAAEKQYQDQLQAALGDDRYAAWQSPDVEVQSALRRDLKGLNANDAQLAAMLDAEHQWSEHRVEVERGLKDNPLTPEAYDAQLRALDAARDQAYQQALGPQGFEQFQKIQDGRYQMMKHYASAWNLTDADVDYLYGVLRDYDQNARDYKQRAQSVQSQGQPVDWAAVQQNLQQFSQQTLTTLRTYLGDDRFGRLNGNNALELNN